MSKRYGIIITTEYGTTFTHEKSYNTLFWVSYTKTIAENVPEVLRATIFDRHTGMVVKKLNRYGVFFGRLE